jgi:hypothetical protein
MSQPILRVLIQEKLANGRSPRTHIPRIWGGPRNGKGLVRGLTLAALAVLGTMTCVASAGAVTAIKSCGLLNTFGATYVLANDISSCGPCLEVANDRITIDLAGHSISGSCVGADFGDEISAGVTDGGTSWQGTTVKNGTITGFEVGVFLPFSTRNQILNLTVSANSLIGISVGEYSIVKGCVIDKNGNTGIFLVCTPTPEGCPSFGSVLDNVITDHLSNGGYGIFGGDRLLVRDNTVENNLIGISVGNSTNVSFNTSRSNVFGGLSAGNRSLVTGNTTNKNGTAGITTGGNTNVSNNTSSDNGGGGIDVMVDAFSDGTRNLVTGNTTNDNGLVGVTAMCPGTVTNNKSSGNGLMDYDVGLACRNNNNK